MKKEEIDLYKKINEKIKEESYKLLSEINEINSIDGFRFLKFKEFSPESEIVLFHGNGGVGYGGGWIIFNYSFNIKLLYDSEAKKLFLEELENKYN